MKRIPKAVLIGLFAVVVIAALLLEALLVYMIFLPDRSRREYEVIRLSPESNVRGDGEDYFLRYANSKKVLRYSFETGEAEDCYIDVPEGNYIERGGAVVDNCIYYVLSDKTVRRLDCEKQIDEEVLSIEDILGMYGREELPEYARVSITRSERCLLLSLHEYGTEYVFLCPVDGDLKTDCIEVNDLFLKEDKTGAEQEIVYEGVRVQRYYDVEKEKYVINEVGDAESGRAIYAYEQWCTIKAGGKLVSLGQKSNGKGFAYYVEGDSEEHEIDWLAGPDYDYSVIQKDKLTVENGEIIGLLHVVKNIRCEPYNPSQSDLKYDILFRLDPETGENSILYRTRNNRTRIIGYRDGVIYLMNDYKIYRKTAGSKGKELFVELPRNHDYMFDWQGDYLIVVCGYEILEAYKIEGRG